MTNTRSILENKEEWLTKFFSQCYESKVLAELVKLITSAVASLDPFEIDLYKTVLMITESSEEVLEDEATQPAVESMDTEDGGKPVPPPKPPKKKDNTLDVSEILSAHPSPSIIIQTLEFLLLNCKKILRRHTHHGAFWQIFDEVSSLSTGLQKAMVRRGHFRALLHLYLQEDSPSYKGDKGPVPTPAHRSKPLQAFLGASAPLLSAISKLACCMGFTRDKKLFDAEIPGSPYGYDDEMHEEVDLAFLFHREHANAPNTKVFFRLIGDQYNMDAVTRLCCHVAWANPDNSNCIISAVCKGVY